MQSQTTISAGEVRTGFSITGGLYLEPEGILRILLTRCRGAFQSGVSVYKSFPFCTEAIVENNHLQQINLIGVVALVNVFMACMFKVHP